MTRRVKVTCMIPVVIRKLGCYMKFELNDVSLLLVQWTTVNYWAKVLFR